MGKPTSESDQTPAICSHFSHPHPLRLAQFAQSSSLCSACKLPAAGDVYSCTSCTFVLHQKCYSLPQKIKHEFDQAHILSLQPKPVYPEGLFKCDACGKEGDGFSYHCSPCGTDLHSICASLPMQLVHQCHPHMLCLTFAAPYAGEAFSCDICKRIGSKIWLYRCHSCEFDVHLTCVANVPSVLHHQHQTTVPQVPPLAASLSLPSHSNPMYQPNVGVYGAPRPIQATNSMPVYNNYPNQPGNYGPVRPANNGMRNQVMAEVAGGVASGIAQAATTAVLQEFGFGGGAAGGAGGGGQVDGGATYNEYTYGGTDAGYGGAEGSYNQ